MSALVTQVKSRLFITSARPSSNALDGDYPSMMRGRSLDFEDLHRYENGDDIRDIDWRATARLGVPLVKRSRAERSQTVLFAVDTGRGMAALSPDGSIKRDLSVLATGVLGYLTLRHGDQFGIVYGDASGISRTEVRRSEGALEIGLRKVLAASVPEAAENSRNMLLSNIVRTVSRRTILVVITDATPISPETERLVRRLHVQHDMLWVTIQDASPLGPAVRRADAVTDVDTQWHMPSFLQGDTDLTDELTAVDERERTARNEFLMSLAISHTELEGMDTAATQLLRMLNWRSRV